MRLEYTSYSIYKKSSPLLQFELKILCKHSSLTCICNCDPRLLMRLALFAAETSHNAIIVFDFPWRSLAQKFAGACHSIKVMYL